MAFETLAQRLVVSLEGAVCAGVVGGKEVGRGGTGSALGFEEVTCLAS